MKRVWLTGIVFGLMFAACGGEPETTDHVSQAITAELSTSFTGFNDMHQKIIYFGEKVASGLPPNPPHPSTTSHYYQQFAIQGAGTSMIWFSITNSQNFVASPSPGHFERGYLLQASTRTSAGVLTLGVVQVAAFPGDKPLFLWHGEVFMPYLEISNNNESGKGTIQDTIAFGNSDVIQTFYPAPFIDYDLDTTSSHNCGGDLPGKSPGFSIPLSETKFQTDVVTADGAHHDALFGAPVPNGNPAIMPLNCNLAVSTQFDASGNKLSVIDTYGL